MSPQEAKILGEYFARQIEEELKTTKKILGALPQNQMQFKLGEKGRTAAQLAWHIVSADRWFGEGVANGNFAGAESEGEPPATVAEILAQYEKDQPPLIARLRNMTGEQLAAPVNFMNMATLPVVLYAGWWLNHSIHHRGQMSAYLRAMNAHVPATYGDSADEPFGAAGATA